MPFTQTEIAMAKREALEDQYANMYASKECTLNGQPAKVTGRMNKYATIMTDHYMVEFSWLSVHEIMSNGGNFTT